MRIPTSNIALCPNCIVDPIGADRVRVLKCGFHQAMWDAGAAGLELARSFGAGVDGLEMSVEEKWQWYYVENKNGD